MWNQIIYKTDERIANTSEAGFTTLIGFGVFDGKIYGASCGDSAVLLIDELQSVFLTEKQRKNPPVGSSGAIPVSFTAKLQNDWKLMAMSDGVWKFLDWETIANTVRNFPKAEILEELKRKYVERHGENLWDDFSIILICKD